MNIFVARLNFKTKREDLQKAFEQFGEVTSAKIVKDRETGRSKGYGFVAVSYTHLRAHETCEYPVSYTHL
ncbi:MAG: RNA recognition motif domain-containing protein, partial [Cyclobacteriaceae bacterium]